MTKLTKQAVQEWVEQAHPAELRDIRDAMAELWRRGLCTLRRREDGEIVGSVTELGESVAKAEEQRDATVCKRCRKSSGDIKTYMVVNTATGSDIIEWMHEDCFVALPLVQ
jgi:hypothetical protein